MEIHRGEEERREAAAAAETSEKRKPIFTDIRRYYCDYCGISRSKKSLLTTHLLAEHKEEMEKEKSESAQGGNVESKSSNTCDQCGASFRKPAYLKQHMLSHSVERPFPCPVEDCQSSYRRKDHLTRHLLQHEGKLFSCPVDGCNHSFAYQANMKRHVSELHEESDTIFDRELFLCPVEGCNRRFDLRANMKRHVSKFHEEFETPQCAPDSEEIHVCSEVGCGKRFKYASKLQKHEESHVKLDSVEAICCEPGCMKSFTNAECLKAHLQSCHKYVNCEVCGTQQLKKNIKRHMQTHEGVFMLKSIKCSFKGCLHTFSSKSNLNQHVKAVHLEERPFACQFSGCESRFAFRHVRDSHEKSGCHVYVQGDFEEADEQFRSKPRGGCKRKCANVETLTRKRVTLPGQVDFATSHPTDYLAWLLSASEGD